MIMWVEPSSVGLVPFGVTRELASCFIVCRVVVPVSALCHERIQQEVITSLQPGRGLSPEPDYAGILILDF